MWRFRMYQEDFNFKSLILPQQALALHACMVTSVGTAYRSIGRNKRLDLASEASVDASQLIEACVQY